MKMKKFFDSLLEDRVGQASASPHPGPGEKRPARRGTRGP
jgi:hypothetical protein